MPTQIVVAIDDDSNRDAWGLRPYGAWTTGAYPQGAVVSYSGSLWIANVQTSGVPGVSGDWAILVPAVVGATGALFPQGGWNASTNSPALASGVGTEGYLYRVSVAGATALDGISAWNIDDMVAFIGGAWRRIIGKSVNSADVIDSSAGGRALLTGSAVALLATNNFSDINNIATARNNLAITPGSSVRQTVMAGPIDASGLPTLIQASTGTLSVSTQNVTSTAPFITTAARGFDNYGRKDALWIETSNVSWTGLAANTTNYLYVNAATGARGSTTLAPIYQHGGTPSTISGQFTFNTTEMKGYLGNGSAAVETPLVFVGHAVTGNTNVASTVSYAYNGFYDSGWTATLPSAGSSISMNSNLGVSGAIVRLIIECTTAEGGYSIGDQIMDEIGTYDAGSNSKPMSKWSSVNTAGFTVGNYSTPWILGNKSSGAIYTPTLANWKYKIVAQRGW